MQIRPEDQPDETTGARRTRGSSTSPTEPIATSSWDRTQAIDRPDLDGGAPTQVNPTTPLNRSGKSRRSDGPDYSNWYESDLYVSEDDGGDEGVDETPTRPIASTGRGSAGTREPVGDRTEAFDRAEAPSRRDERETTAPQPISSERAAWGEDDQDADPDDRYPDDQDDQNGRGRRGRAAALRSDRLDRDDRVDDRAFVSARDPYRASIGAKLGLLVLGLLLAVIAALLLGMNGTAAAPSVRAGAPLGGGLLAVLGFGAGVLCVAVVLIAGRTSSTAPLMGSLIGLPALVALFSGDAAALVRGQLTSWSVPGPMAEAFVRPETALAGVLLFLIGVAFSTRRRAEDLAGPVSSFFLGLFSTICFLPGLALFCLGTQENLLRSFAQAGWPSAEVTRPLSLVLGIVLMAIGVACTSRAPGGMVVAGVLVLVVALAAGFLFLAGSTVLPAGVFGVVQRDVTATAPLAALLAGLSLLVASFAGLSLGREPERSADWY
ncbi:tetraspanin family protein [Tersicoccus sp. Bi-70]|uniref:tetraspanin family protein n=1 Tax=Tersicoccus sp. Bi-70 TaxID=1897634 RepID=UPI00097826DF|nr:tetraspanin family protein [Tersicoccus sp. Bi-70]OMH32390.1 hypothetical protein BGP79_08230 [Tersicoccus sp. Bi-70]